MKEAMQISIIIGVAWTLFCVAMDTKNGAESESQIWVLACIWVSLPLLVIPALYFIFKIVEIMWRSL